MTGVRWGYPPLAMVDDLLAVTDCGIESAKTNGFLNAKTNVKNFSWGRQVPQDACGK